MSHPQLEQIRRGIANISNGKSINEDSWMTMWCDTNWGDLLQPAPLAASLLSSVVVASIGARDFSLEGEKTYQWKYLAHTRSFRSCLMQLVGSGIEAQAAMQKDMMTMFNRCEMLPEMVRSMAQLLLQAEPREMAYMLPDRIEEASNIMRVSVEASRHCEDTFAKVCGLTQELMLACTYQPGLDEKRTEATQQLAAILSKQNEQDAAISECAAKTKELVIEAFKRAEEELKEALQSAPRDWNVVGASVVENITQAVTSACNAALGVAALKAEATRTSLGAVPGFATSQSQGAADAPMLNAAALTDPGVVEATYIRGYIDALNLLVRGGQDDSPDWKMIIGDSARVASTSGAVYVENALNKSAHALKDGQPISKQLLPVVNKALELAKTIQKIAQSPDANNNAALKTYWSDMDGLVADINTVVTQCSLILRQPALTVQGIASPRPPVTDSASSAKLSAESSQRTVIAHRATLECARDSSDRAAALLLESRDQLFKAMRDTAQSNFMDANAEAILPLLKQVLGAFTTLKAQASQFLQTFAAVASILNDVLLPNIQKWIKFMEDNTAMAGVSTGSVYRQLVYTQVMVPLKVSLIVQKIFTAHHRTSEQFIMPLQRTVGGMMQMFGNDMGGGNDIRRITRSQEDVGRLAEQANNAISEIIQGDQRKFRDNINSRLTRINETLSPVFPAIRDPLPPRIEDVKKEAVANFDNKIRSIRARNTMYGL